MNKWSCFGPIKINCYGFSWVRTKSQDFRFHKSGFLNRHWTFWNLPKKWKFLRLFTDVCAYYFTSVNFVQNELLNLFIISLLVKNIKILMSQNYLSILVKNLFFNLFLINKHVWSCLNTDAFSFSGGIFMLFRFIDIQNWQCKDWFRKGVTKIVNIFRKKSLFTFLIKMRG